MTPLAEIEAAAAALPPAQKQELFFFLIARFRTEGLPLPEPRKFSREQLADWISRDEAVIKNFRDGA